MVDKLRGKYLFQKRGVYYFSKQIPKDVRQHYSQNRIVQSLKTKSVKDAFYQSQNLLHKLNQHWFYLRVKDENTVLTPILPMTLERAIEFIREGEIVEVTPNKIRLRKVLLSANGRHISRSTKG